jgi:hypothetical protein
MQTETGLSNRQGERQVQESAEKTKVTICLRNDIQK